MDHRQGRQAAVRFWILFKVGPLIDQSAGQGSKFLAQGHVRNWLIVYISNDLDPWPYNMPKLILF